MIKKNLPHLHEIVSKNQATEALCSVYVDEKHLIACDSYKAAVFKTAEFFDPEFVMLIPEGGFLVAPEDFKTLCNSFSIVHVKDNVFKCFSSKKRPQFVEFETASSYPDVLSVFPSEKDVSDTRTIGLNPTYLSDLLKVFKPFACESFELVFTGHNRAVLVKPNVKEFDVEVKCIIMPVAIY